MEKEKYTEKEAMLVSLVNKESEEKAEALKRIDEAVATANATELKLKEEQAAVAALKIEKGKQ